MGTHKSYDATRCCPFVCDLSSTKDIGQGILVQKIKREHSLDDHGGGVDLAMMMFCLSAIHPKKMTIAIGNVANVMKENGILWFRDYAENDNAQLKFGMLKEAKEDSGGSLVVAGVFWKGFV